MKKYINLIIFALCVAFSLSVVSCCFEEDDDTDSIDLKDGTNHVNRTSSGYLIISNTSGDVLYVDSVSSNPKGSGFQVWSTEQEGPYTLTCKAYLRPEGSSPSNTSTLDGKIYLVRVDVKNYNHVDLGYLTDLGHVEIGSYKYYGRNYEFQRITDYFSGYVSIIAFDGHYMTVKFTDCWLSNAKICFNGVIKFGTNYDMNF